VILALAVGCRTPRAGDPIYRPTETVLEVVSVLSLHIDDDTYRFPPARDFTGKNVYRAVFERLESLEEIHEAKFRSGYLIDVILFSKGRALERLGDYDLAAQHYLRVTDLDSALAGRAAESRDVCSRIRHARGMRPDGRADPEEALTLFDQRTALLEAVLADAGETHYPPVVREEMERADLERARYFRRESKLYNRHLLELAALYAELARDYAHEFPPPSLTFDPPTFDEYAFGATRLYEAVAHQDGAIEKIEAARKLEAFLAFSLGVRDASLRR
jgi:tetratricopeptide (TPR) repeat protein